MAATNNPVLTQSDIDSLNQKYGSIAGYQDLGLKAGMPMSVLVPSYMGLMGTGLGNIDDPIRDELVQGGWLQSGSDTQGNAGWAAGPSYAAAVDAAYKASGGTPGQPLKTNQTFNSEVGFSASRGAYEPGGLSGNVPIQQQMNKMLSGVDASVGYKGLETVGGVDPVTGQQQYDWSGAVPVVSQIDRFSPMIGPLIGAAVSGGMGALGMFGELGTLGQYAFNTAGQAIEGQSPNPMNAIGPIINSSGGGGPLQQLMTVLREW